MNKNKDSTRYYSDQHEKSVCKALGARQQSNSGAGLFNKGDVVTDSFLIECKTCMYSKDSVSVKKEWLEKNQKESRLMHKPYSAVCINFEPGGKNYYIIDENLFKDLVEFKEDL